MEKIMKDVHFEVADLEKAKKRKQRTNGQGSRMGRRTFD